MPDEPLYVNGETISLREMIRNIVENALIHARGPVTISLSQNGATITLGVHDRGAGLATDMKDRVFERFVRADQSKPGSGLGLSIAKWLRKRWAARLNCVTAKVVEQACW